MASSPPCLWRIPTMIVLLIFVSSCAFGDSTPVSAEGLELDMNGEELRVGVDHHHIHKRAAVTLPDNVTFTLTKEGNSENTVEIRVGKKVSFKLQIMFPQTTTDMLVELFAPDNESIVMMLCNVKIANFGANLDRTGAAEIVMDSQNQSSKFFDRAIIDFGNVSNSFTDQSDELASCIVITWDAVMIDNENTQDNAVYWVSAGAEYANENEVWVGQASFTAHTSGTDPNLGLYDQPILNLTGPPTMMIGSSGIFRLDIYIDQPSISLSVDAFAALNKSNVMSICDMKVVDTGENYKCGFIPEEHVATFHQEKNTWGNDRARLELHTVINKGAREADNSAHMNRITVEFLVQMNNDVTFVGETFNVACAVEIGSSKIWTGIIVVTATAYAPSTGLNPSLQVTPEGSSKVSKVAPLLINIDITIPQDTTGRYAVDILAPFVDDAAVFQLCSLSVVSKGANLACMESNPMCFYLSRGSPIFTDRIYLDMGTFTNVGPWGWQPYNLTDPSATDPDTVRMQFLVKATNHSQATPGSKHDVIVGLNMDDIRLEVATLELEVDSDVTLPNITDDMTPDWLLAMTGGENVRIGGAGQFMFTITTKRNTVYSPFDVEALMPNSTTGDPQVSLCKVQVTSVGRNLPCFVAAAVNESVEYTSSFNLTTTSESFYDRGVVNVLSLCNRDLENSTEADQIVFKVGFRLHADGGLTNGTELWPSVGVMFSPYRMWVGQIRAWARDDQSNRGLAPHVVVLKASAGDVPLGYFAGYNVLIKTVPGDIVPYTVNISVSSPGLSVCSVRILKVGDNMPCTNGTALVPVHEKDAEGFTVKGSYDFGTISNVGSSSDAVARDSTVDDNTVVLEVLIGVSPDGAILAEGSTHSFAVVVNHDSSSVNPAVPDFTVTHNQSSLTGAAVNVSSVELSVVAITDTDNATDVVLGQSKRVEMCAWTYPGSVTKLSFKMMTPIDMYGVLEVVYIGISYGGENMPCVGSCKAGSISYTSRAGSSYTDIATMDLGYNVNNNMNTVSPDANKVCVDGVFRVLKNDTLEPGEMVKPAAALNVNDVEISVVELSLTVVDNSTFTDIYQDNATLESGAIISVNSSVPSPLCLKPSDVYTLPVVVTVPPYVTTQVNMDVKMDVDQSACTTFQDMRLISVGQNLRGFGKEDDLQCTPNSTMGSSQMDTAQCNFGIVTNPGMSHRCEDQATDDDAIYLEVDIQMADCPLADDGANVTVSLGLKEADYIAILNLLVHVERDGSEAPVFNITANANSTGDDMYIEYDVRLDNTSTAEVHNASLIVMPPQYVTCNTLNSWSGRNTMPDISTTDSSATIDLGSIYFTDVIVLVVHCVPTSGYKVPSGVSGHNTVVVSQLVGDVILRAGMTSSTVWSPLDYVNVTVSTVSESGVTCSSAALGVEHSNIIYDCQISASDPSFSSALHGRKSASGWIPFVREGELAKHRYFQVYFPNKMLVNEMEIYHTNANTAKATQIKLAYGDDGRCLLQGDTINLSGQNPETVVVPNPQESRVLRVYVTETDVPGERIGLTFEFSGCPVTSGGLSTEADICEAASKAVPTRSWDPPFYHRTLVAVDGGAIIFCDGVVKTTDSCMSSVGGEVVNRCYYGDGSVWRPVDPRVAAMVGYDAELRRVLAVSDNRVTYMTSGDQGRTWASTHSSMAGAVVARPTFKNATYVPWTHSSEFSDPPAADHQNGDWGVSYETLKMNEGGVWKDKLTDCC